MSPRNREKNEHMRTESIQKITDAALRVFAEYGYHGATMKKITRATGLSYGLVYHYFPSKEKIFLHLVDIVFENSNLLINKALETSGTAWDKIMAFSELLVKEMVTGELSLHFLITLQAMTQGKDIPGLFAVIRERTKNYEKFDDLISMAQKSGDVAEGDPKILSAAYLSLVQGLALMMFHDKNIGQDITPDILNNLLRRKND